MALARAKRLTLEGRQKQRNRRQLSEFSRAVGGTLLALAGDAMKAPLNSLVLWLIALSAACSNLASSVDPGSGANGTEGKDSSHAGANGGGHDSNDGSGAAATKASAGASGKAGESGGGVLSLATVDAHVVGRNGNGIRFTVKGTQPDSKVASISVSFRGGDGKPVPVFDGDWDGSPDTADGRIVLDSLPTDAAFTASATISGLLDATKLLEANVALVDGDDNSSAQVSAQILQQRAKKLGESCDPSYVLDRCEAGESCAGAPTVCTAGVPPVLAELRYLHATYGPVILARGTDPDDDMGKFHIELLDANNKPVTVDLDSGPTTAIDTQPAFISAQGTFYGYNKGGLTLDTQVPKVRVTPVDSLGHEGPPQLASIAALTRAADGGGCDARGFIGCPADEVCTPGLPVVVGRCAKGKGLRQSACAGALKLDPAKGVIAAAGVIDGSSLWDPPHSCTNDQNIDRPEGVVRLHLAAAVAKLTISTRRPETNVDTVLYVLPGCADDSKDALDCNDDAPTGGFASELVLKKVPAGDYAIVVESAQLGGGSFGVSVATD